MIQRSSQTYGWLCLLVWPFLISVPPISADAPSEPQLTYHRDIVPIFREECFSCHNEDDPQGELDLTRYATMMEGGASGAVIDPGNLSNSPLYSSVAHTIEPSMPPESPPIAKESIERIGRWIETGAAEGKVEQEVALAAENLKQWIPKKFEPGAGPLPPRLSRQTRLHTERNPTSRSLAVSPNAPLLAVPGNRQIWLYRTDTLEPLGRFAFPEGEIAVLRFSRDGSLLLAAGGEAGRNGKVVLWRISAAERVLELGDEFDTVLAADISGDNRRVALGGASGKVKLYDVPAKKLVAKIDAHTDRITAIAFSPDGVLLASADHSGGLHIHEGWTGKPYLILPGSSDALADLAWRADSNILASGGADRIVRLWEVEKGKKVKEFEPGATDITSVSAVPDARWLISRRDGNTRLLRSEGALERSFGPLADLVTASRFCALAGRVIASGYEGEVVVFDATDGKQIARLDNNPPPLAQSLKQARHDAEKALGALIVNNAKYKSAKKVAEQSGLELSEMQLQLTKAHATRQKIDQKLLTIRREVHQHVNHLAELEANITEQTKALPKQRPENKETARSTLSALRKQRSATIIAIKLLRNKIKTLSGEHQQTAGPIAREEVMTMIARSESADAQHSEAAAKQRLLASIEARNHSIAQTAALLDDASFAATIEVLMQRRALLEKAAQERKRSGEGAADGGSNGGDEKAESPTAPAAAEQKVPDPLEKLRSQIREIRMR